MIGSDRRFPFVLITLLVSIIPPFGEAINFEALIFGVPHHSTMITLKFGFIDFWFEGRVRAAPLSPGRKP
ncbi:hypothetical protein HanIR_Chr09g0404401 [Helianthus annuus]|nr:hypothetical protein HanIR_Chr09g0404401 [Helianthus annuus]